MRFRSAAITVIVFAVAMAYLESAVVVYLQRALSLTPADLFPLRGPNVVGDLGAIEVGREFSTLVMLAGIGWLAGRSSLERLAWGAVAFGVWDIFYYFWLWVFIGWPGSPGTWDVLFLIPVPWIGPVWAPIIVSGALVGFGLAAAQGAAAGLALQAGWRELALGVAGGLLVVLSFTLDASRIMAGGLPGWFPWPIFVAGMAFAATGAILVLRRAERGAQRA
jgi:hypothetical protein